MLKGWGELSYLEPWTFGIETAGKWSQSAYLSDSLVWTNTTRKCSVQAERCSRKAFLFKKEEVGLMSKGISALWLKQEWKHLTAEGKLMTRGSGAVKVLVFWQLTNHLKWQWNSNDVRVQREVREVLNLEDFIYSPNWLSVQSVIE